MGAECGVVQAIDLEPNGSNIPVTRDNKLKYIPLVSHYRLTKQNQIPERRDMDGANEGRRRVVGGRLVSIVDQMDQR